SAQSLKNLSPSRRSTGYPVIGCRLSVPRRAFTLNCLPAGFLPTTDNRQLVWLVDELPGVFVPLDIVCRAADHHDIQPAVAVEVDPLASRRGHSHGVEDFVAPLGALVILSVENM